MSVCNAMPPVLPGRLAVCGSFPKAARKASMIAGFGRGLDNDDGTGWLDTAHGVLSPREEHREAK